MCVLDWNASRPWQDATDEMLINSIFLASFISFPLIFISPSDLFVPFACKFIHDVPNRFTVSFHVVDIYKEVCFQQPETCSTSYFMSWFLLIY